MPFIDIVPERPDLSWNPASLQTDEFCSSMSMTMEYGNKKNNNIRATVPQLNDITAFHNMTTRFWFFSSFSMT